MTAVKIVIGADLVPTKENYALFSDAKVGDLCGDKTIKLLHAADLCIFNIETPLTDHESPIEKTGPCFQTPTNVVAGIQALGINLVTLANNHIMDQGEMGFQSTIETLKNAGIGFVGAGDNLPQAAKPFIFSCRGKRIGVYACAEHEFSIAEDNKPGANPFDPLYSLDHIEELKAECDYVIVLYHGGKEHYQYPSPGLQRICRRIVEKGADLVVCQHSHCIGCMEEYQNGTVVYGQGNFLFHKPKYPLWRTGLLIEVVLDEKAIVKYHPLSMSQVGIRYSEDQQILSDFEQRSREILCDGFVNARYDQFCGSFDHLMLLFGGIQTRGIIYRAINKITGCRFGKWCAKRMPNAQKRLIFENYIVCESWREIVVRKMRNRK